MLTVVNADIDETEDDLSTASTTLHYAIVHNPGASTAYLKIYFDDAANIAVGTDSPNIEVAIPAGETHVIPLGDRRCSAGACWAAGANAGADATAPASGLHGTAFISG